MNKVILTGTMGSDRLYHLNIPHHQHREFVYHTTIPYLKTRAASLCARSFELPDAGIIYLKGYDPWS